MDKSLMVSPSPHIRSSVNSTKIMLDVIIALVPALIASVFIFGWRALAVVAVCVLVSVVSEWGFEKICKRDVTVGDLSAAVTGVLLAFNLPVEIPLWQAAFGSIVAIVAVKQLFGGIGCNFANPAITARIVMFLSFSVAMADFDTASDAVSSATPLALAGTDNATPIIDLLLGKHAGSLGETCAIALIIGGVYLIVRRVITWHIPFYYVATFMVLTAGFAYYTGDATLDPLTHLLSGGLFLGAFFMATDYTTSPMSKKGKIIFAIGCGVLTFVIRRYSAYPEGVSFAILIMNAFVPLIDKLARPRIFGTGRK